MKIRSVYNFIYENSFKIYSSIFAIGLILGLINSDLKSRNISLDNISFSSESFFTILINNIFLGLSLLFGFLFFNIYNVVAVFINGLFWGFFINNFFGNLGFLNTLLLFLPHAILEYYWIVSISVYSTKLSNDFYQFLNTNFDDNSIYKNIINIYILKLMSLIFISAIVENYVTTYIFNFINK